MAYYQYILMVINESFQRRDHEDRSLYWTNAPASTTPTITRSCQNKRLKSTSPIPINRSIACPNKIGVINVKQTLIKDKINIKPKITRYGRQYVNNRFIVLLFMIVTILTML